MCTSPVYSSRSTFCISQCVFEGEPTLMRIGFKVTISLAAVVSHTQLQELPVLAVSGTVGVVRVRVWGVVLLR